MKRNKSLWRFSLYAHFIVSSVSFIFLAEVAWLRFDYINTWYTSHVPRSALHSYCRFRLYIGNAFSLYAPPICTTTRRTASIQATQIASTRLHFSRTTPFTVSRIPLEFYSVRVRSLVFSLRQPLPFFSFLGLLWQWTNLSLLQMIYHFQESQKKMST